MGEKPCMVDGEMGTGGPPTPKSSLIPQAITLRVQWGPRGGTGEAEEQPWV